MGKCNFVKKWTQYIYAVNHQYCCYEQLRFKPTSEGTDK